MTILLKIATYRDPHEHWPKTRSNQHPADAVVLSGVRVRIQRGMIRKLRCELRTLQRDPEKHFFRRVCSACSRAVARPGRRGICPYVIQFVNTSTQDAPSGRPGPEP